MSGYIDKPAGRLYQPDAAGRAIEQELSSFMLRVFNPIADGLVLTGIVAYAAAWSSRTALDRDRGAISGLRESARSNKRGRVRPG